MKQSEVKGSFINKSVGEEKKKFEKSDVNATEVKVEKKPKGNSRIDCHYYNGANHLANDCMLRNKEEKKNKVKDKAYYVEKLEEVRIKAKNLPLVARGECD